MGSILAGALVAPVLVSLFGLDTALIIAGAVVPVLPLLGLPAIRRLEEVAISAVSLPTTRRERSDHAHEDSFDDPAEGQVSIIERGRFSTVDNTGSATRCIPWNLARGVIV